MIIFWLVSLHVKDVNLPLLTIIWLTIWIGFTNCIIIIIFFFKINCQSNHIQKLFKFCILLTAGGDTLTFKAWNLRPSLIWKDGQWTQWVRFRDVSCQSYEVWMFLSILWFDLVWFSKDSFIHVLIMFIFTIIMVRGIHLLRKDQS